MDLGGGEVEYDQNALHEILKEFIKKKKKEKLGIVAHLIPAPEGRGRRADGRGQYISMH